MRPFIDYKNDFRFKFLDEFEFDNPEKFFERYGYHMCDYDRLKKEHESKRKPNLYAGFKDYKKGLGLLDDELSDKKFFEHYGYHKCDYERAKKEHRKKMRQLLGLTTNNWTCNRQFDPEKYKRDYSARVEDRCKEIGAEFVRGITQDQIELKCHCGHVWQPRLSNFLGPLKTGCKYCAKRGYRASIPGTFYVVKWTHPETNKSYLKYGVSNTPKSRLKSQAKLTEYVPTVLYESEFKDGSIPWKLEGICDVRRDELYGRKNYVVSKDDFPDGYTETMNVDQYDWLNNMLFENTMCRLKSWPTTH
ncbi:hypothetical protein [Aeromonas salmonicida]